MKLWRPDRCAVCGKKREHTCHQLENPRPPWWRLLLGIIWPRWTWGERAGIHVFQDDSQRATNAEVMYRIRQSIRKRRS